MNLDARSDSSSFFPPPPTMPFKVHVSAFKASVDDARIIIGWTSTTYQMQAAAAVGGRGLNMPRGAAVKPVSRLQGTKQTHTGSRHGCHISLSSPVAPRGQREGATSPCPGRGRRGGAVPVRGTTTNNMSGLTQPAPPSHDNDSNTTASAAAWRGKLCQTWKRGGRLKKLKNNFNLLHLEHFNQSRSERLRLARSPGSGEFDLPSGKAAEFLAASPFLTLPD